MRSIRWLPRVLLAVAVLVAVGLAYVVSNETASVLTAVAGFALVGLSVGLLTGTSGQLSLGQFAYAGIAAAVSVHVIDRTENFVLGVALGVAAAAAISAVVGIPALKLRGLGLAVSTLAFALATSAWLLRLDVFLGDGVQPAKPTWFGYPLELAKDYYLFALLMLALGLWVAGNLRRSGFGLSLQALRDNEDAARAFTVPSRRRKLQLYAVSGALAGLGGVVIGHSQTQLTVNSFPAAASIDVVALTVIGGLGVTSGPILGALIIVGLPALVGLGLPGQAALAVGWLAVVVFLPDGLGGVLVRARDALADFAARRAGIDPVLARGGAATPPTSPLHVRARLDGLVPDLGGAASDAGPALVVTGLSRHFGGVVAVDGVDFEVRRGEILGVIGPNGAGKTTVFEIVAGFTAPDAGRVVFEGTDVTAGTPEQRARAGLVRSFQDAALFSTLTVRETLMVARERLEPTWLWSAAVGANLPDRTKSAAADELMERMGLTPFAAPDDLRALDRHPSGRGDRLPADAAAPAAPARRALGRHRAGRERGPRRAAAGHPRGVRHHDGRHRARPPAAQPAERPDDRDEPRPGHRRGHARRGATAPRGGPLLPGRRVGRQRGGAPLRSAPVPPPRRPSPPSSSAARRTSSPCRR